MLVNEVPATLGTMLGRELPGMALADGGVVSYDGLTDNSINFGGADGKPLVAPLTIGVTEFLNVLDKPNSFGLTISKARMPYLFSLSPKTISVFKYAQNAWVADGVFTTPANRDFVPADVVGFRITDAKIELQLGGVTVWEKARTWTITPSAAALGVLAPAGPYTFGQVPTLTIGSASGMYTLGFANQEGSQFNLAQGIAVTDVKAVPTTTTPDPIMTALPVIAAAAVLQQPLQAQQSLAQTGTSASPAETTDWGKVLTWVGVGLGSFILLIILLLAFRKPK